MKQYNPTPEEDVWQSLFYWFISKALWFRQLGWLLLTLLLAGVFLAQNVHAQERSAFGESGKRSLKMWQEHWWPAIKKGGKNLGMNIEPNFTRNTQLITLYPKTCKPAHGLCAGTPLCQISSSNKKWFGAEAFILERAPLGVVLKALEARSLQLGLQWATSHYQRLAKSLGLSANASADAFFLELFRRIKNEGTCQVGRKPPAAFILRLQEAMQALLSNGVSGHENIAIKKIHNTFPP